MNRAWSKSDWRAKPRVQMPTYTDQAALEAVETQLAKYPPLVFAGEARNLRARLAEVSVGKAFLLQGGVECRFCQSAGAGVVRLVFQVAHFLPGGKGGLFQPVILSRFHWGVRVFCGFPGSPPKKISSGFKGELCSSKPAFFIFLLTLLGGFQRSIVGACCK